MDQRMEILCGESHHRMTGIFARPDFPFKVPAMRYLIILNNKFSKFDIPYETIRSLEEIPKLNPDYIVIASNTGSHKNQLMFLEENLIGKKILVEKPLFDFMADLVVKHNMVYVGYNLRFHPLLQKIKNRKRAIWADVQYGTETLSVLLRAMACS